MHTRAQQRRPAGFTLVEMLVVVAVLAVLAGLLFPVYARAREKARASACLSNARQLGAALMLYAQDNDDQIVPSIIGELHPEVPGHVDDLVTWPALLRPYVKGRRVSFCPSFQMERLIRADTAPDCYGPANAGLFEPPFAPFAYEPDGSHFGLAFAGVAGDCTRANPRRAYPGAGYDLETERLSFRTLAEIQRPAQTCILSEGSTARASDGGILLAFGCSGRGAHFDGQDLVFLDGHVRFAAGNPERIPNFQDSSGCWNSTYFTYDR